MEREGRKTRRGYKHISLFCLNNISLMNYFHKHHYSRPLFISTATVFTTMSRESLTTGLPKLHSRYPKDLTNRNSFHAYMILIRAGSLLILTMFNAVTRIIIMATTTTTTTMTDMGR